MATTPWTLSLVFWLHMLATISWIGGLAVLAVLVLPAARKSLDTQAYLSFIGQIRRRFDPLVWFSLVILAGTGMLQMGANPNYQGVLAIDNPWSLAIFVKHLLFLLMAGLSGYMTWVLLPGLNRLALLRARQQNGAGVGEKAAVLETQEHQEEQLLRREDRLIRMNLVLGVLVLALTAIARVA